VAPTDIYPLFEQALRHAAGRGVEDHLDHLGRLWAGFAAVAATNPHAWIQDGPSAAHIRTPSEGNRWVCWPYTKLMCANNAVEQGAAVIVCSAERAAALGVPRDRWVFPWAVTEAHDTYAVSHRPDLCSSPAIRLAGRRLFGLAGLGVDDVAHVDLYSCFPSAVQIAAAELGLGLDRPLTVTGGLSFAGGPWNNYVTHALAAMAQVLRAEPGSVGLVTANGGYVTKHALGLYSTEPPPAFRWADVQEAVDATPRRELCEAPDGPATIESWVVRHGRDGAPERAVASCLLADGRRAWGVSEHADTVAELRDGAEHIGRTVTLTPEGALLLR
jgi:acetyl-CoA C-acetyltransferase